MWPDDFGDAFPEDGPLPNPEKRTPRRRGEPGMLIGADPAHSPSRKRPR